MFICRQLFKIFVFSLRKLLTDYFQTANAPKVSLQQHLQQFQLLRKRFRSYGSILKHVEF